MAKSLLRVGESQDGFGNSQNGNCATLRSMQCLTCNKGRRVISPQVNRTDIRELPKNIEAEQVVLGATMLESESVGMIAIDMLIPEDFYELRHRVIFRVMIELLGDKGSLDIITLANRIDERGEMDRAGGRMYLNHLLDQTSTTASFEHFAEIVRKKRILRQLIEAGGRISEMGYNEADDPLDLLDRATALVLEPQTVFGGAEIGHISIVGEEYVNVVKSLADKEVGLGTGYKKLDDDLYDLRGQLTILAGSPSCGKTVTGLNMIRNQLQRGHRCGIITLEMRRTAVAERMMQMVGHVTREEIRYDEKKRIAAAMKTFALPLWISEVRPKTLPAVLRQMRVLVQRDKVDTIFIDYLQLVRGPKADREDIEIGMVTKAFLEFAQDNDVAVITPSQANRQAMAEKSEPRLWHMKSSSRIEEDASIVLGIWRPSYITNDKVAEREDFFIRVLKNRSGISGGRTKLIFFPYEQRIEQLAVGV